MSAPEPGHLRLGPTLIRWAGDERRAADEILVDVSGHPDAARGWLDSHGLLAVQALLPVIGLEPALRSRREFLAVGPGAPVAGLGAVAAGLRRVDVVLHPDDVAPFENLAARIEGVPAPRVLPRLEAAADEAHYHVALLGCDGEIPSAAACAPLVDRLRPEGLLVVLGFPSGALHAVYADLAEHGLSLRGSGFRDGLGFLTGSLEHHHQFTA